MQKKTINFAIIGCGMIAGLHADAINFLKENATDLAPVLVGAYDDDLNRAESFAVKYNICRYESPERLLNDGDVDAVCICTPNGTHASLALKTLKHGKHVLVEKPLALTADDCNLLINEANRRGLCAGVISQRRFSETTAAVYNAINEGKLGALVSAELSIKYYRDFDYYHKSAWHGSKTMDGGVLMNQGIHGIDIMLHLMGDVKHVSAFCANRVHDIEAEDTVSASFEFNNGALGTLFATTAAYPGIPQTLTLVGEKGSITLTENDITQWNIDGVSMPDAKALSAGGFGKAENIALDGHIAQISDFANAVYFHRQPKVSLNDGEKVVKFITSVYASAAAHKKH